MRLISVWRLNNAGIEASFNQHHCHLRKDNKIIMSVSGKDGIFEISGRSKSIALNTATPNLNLSQISLQETIITNQDQRVIRNEESIWELHHRRLRYINFQDIKRLVDLGVLKGKIKHEKRTIFQGEKNCESYLAERMKERFNKKTDTREHVKGRRLHADISGIQENSVQGLRYFLVVVDDASRMYWVTLQKSKEANEVMNMLRQIISMVELQCGGKAWYFRADNGKSEFGTTFQEFLKKKGTQFEPCPPYKHSINGVAERAIGILATYARSRLFEAQLPEQFWDYAIEHAMWIRNRVPTSALPFGPDNCVTRR